MDLVKDVCLLTSRDDVRRIARSKEVIHFFDNVKITGVFSFRALCNSFKASVIDCAVNAWRNSGKGRFNVVDLGCGRGGDLQKWSRYRLKTYVGVDGSPICIHEASERQAALVSQGKSNVHSYFYTKNLIHESIPVEDRTADIVSSMFFLQFAFSDESSARYCLRESSRIMKTGGIFCAVIPDGNRVSHLLQGKDRRAQIPFGHFRLRNMAPNDETQNEDTSENDPVGLSGADISSLYRMKNV